MMMKMEEECHQGLESFESPEATTEAAPDQEFHAINFSFSCHPVYIFTLNDMVEGHSDFMGYNDAQPVIEKSIRVELRDLDNWEEARRELDGLFRGFPMSWYVRDELARFAVDTAKDMLLSSGGHRVLHLHIPFDVVHEHIFVYDNDDVNSV